MLFVKLLKYYYDIFPELAFRIFDSSIKVQGVFAKCLKTLKNNTLTVPGFLTAFTQKNHTIQIFQLLKF